MEKQDKAALPKTVDEYLMAQSAPVQAALEQVRQVIRKTAPEATELISYQMPGYKYKGKPLVYIAGWPKHCSLYGISRALLSRLQPELKAFRIDNTTIHFTPESPLPAALVEKIVRLRMEQIGSGKNG